jgi:hypothetical protein
MEKLLIKPEAGDELKALFNPKEIVFTKNCPWKEHHIQGADSPEKEFTSGEPFRLHMELFFDTYEEKKSVREHTNKLDTYITVNPDLHAPPKLTVVWGTALNFKCVLESLSVRFTMFKDDGTPVRAVANCTFAEYTPVEEQHQAKKRHSADHTKRRVVKQGDTLSYIAGKEYRDPRKWRVIADANLIDNPRDLAPGQELIIPPIV